MKLTTRSALFAFFPVAALLTSGCVSSGTYKAKEQESIQLSRNLEETKGAYQELEEKNKKLTAEGEALNEKLKKLNTEIADFKLDIEKLKVDNAKYKLEGENYKLENENYKFENEKLSLAAKPENLLKTLADSIAALQAENAKLRQSLVLAEKVPVKKDPEPPVILNPVVTKPAAAVEENSAGKAIASPETGKESAPQPVDTSEKPAELKNEESREQTPVIDDNLPKEPAAELK